MTDTGIAIACLSRMTKPCTHLFSQRYGHTTLETCPYCEGTGANPLLALTKGCPRTHLGDLCYDCKGTYRALLPLDSAAWVIVKWAQKSVDSQPQRSVFVKWLEMTSGLNISADAFIDAAHSVLCQDNHEGGDDANEPR